jgi:hypothetical protein
MSVNNKKLQNTLTKLYKLFVEEQYSDIFDWSNGIRLTEEQIREAIKDYGEVIIFPPTTFFNDVDIVEINSSNPSKWAVTFPFWTKNEGKSDLSVEITCIDSLDDIYTIEVDNIHVL